MAEHQHEWQDRCPTYRAAWVCGCGTHKQPRGGLDPVLLQSPRAIFFRPDVGHRCAPVTVRTA